MDSHNNRVANVINAPTTKVLASVSRYKEDHGLINDRKHIEYEENRVKQEKLHS